MPPDGAISKPCIGSTIWCCGGSLLKKTSRSNWRHRGPRSFLGQWPGLSFYTPPPISSAGYAGSAVYPIDKSFLMALWLVWAGKYGEHEEKFFTGGRVYLSAEALVPDLCAVKDQADTLRVMTEVHPAERQSRIAIWAERAWNFSMRMKPADWVVAPHRNRPLIAVGEIAGAYTFDPEAEPMDRHYHTVNWIHTEVPRSAIEQDLLLSFNTFLNFCQISKNDAENRVRNLAATLRNAAQSSKQPALPGLDFPEESIDLGRLAHDQVTRLIARSFRGASLTRLIEAILKAQGYRTYRNAGGGSRSAEILASPGPLGFGRPTLCVHVETGIHPAERPVLNQLLGAMQKLRIERGLLVSWSGFRADVDSERPNHFFRVQLWDQDHVVREVMENYPNLDSEMRLVIPLKPVWALAMNTQEFEA